MAVRFWASAGAEFPKLEIPCPGHPWNHRAKFDAASFILTGEIGNCTKLQTNHQTVNDISTPCLSACVDNNDNNTWLWTSATVTTDVVLLVSQVHHQVLGDQRESFLDNIIASVSSNRQTLENAVSTKDLDKIWSRINGVCFVCMILCVVISVAGIGKPTSV